MCIIQNHKNKFGFAHLLNLEILEIVDCESGQYSTWLSQISEMLTHLRWWVARAAHDLKWVNISIHVIYSLTRSGSPWLTANKLSEKETINEACCEGGALDMDCSVTWSSLFICECSRSFSVYTTYNVNPSTDIVWRTYWHCRFITCRQYHISRLCFSMWQCVYANYTPGYVLGYRVLKIVISEIFIFKSLEWSIVISLDVVNNGVKGDLSPLI